MRLLITGGNGQLGTDLAAFAIAAGHDVEPVSRAVCDIAVSPQVDAALDAARPDVLVNCGAWTKVDLAESAADDAFRANAVGPRILATACERRRVRLVHISSDYVFDGRATRPIDEWQPAAFPPSVYGASKLAGEIEVRELVPRHQIVRTSWLYGHHGPNFVLTMLRLAQQGSSVRVVADQMGSPTWTGHLAPAILRLIERDVSGTYHLTNSGATSWHGFAAAIFAAVGAEVDLVPIRTADFPTAAPRPAYSVLENRAWRLLGEDPLPSWQEGVRSYISELQRRQVLDPRAIQ